MRTEQHAKLLDIEEEGEQALMVDCEPFGANVMVHNSFEALAPDSDDESDRESGSDSESEVTASEIVCLQ